MKRNVNVWECAPAILEALGKGALVTAKAGDRVNPMTIGWGTLGIEWGKPIFTVYVRESRFTKTLLDRNPEFTVSVPYGAPAKEILAYCGSKSGRDADKVKALGLTLEEPEKISVPGIRELPLTLECRVLFSQDQAPEAIDPACRERYYPQDQDYHTAYYGQIVAAYIIE